MAIPSLEEMNRAAKRILDKIADEMAEPDRERYTADEHEIRHKLRLKVFWEQFGVWLSDNCTQADLDNMRQDKDFYWVPFESFRVRCAIRRKKIDERSRPQKTQA